MAKLRTLLSWILLAPSSAGATTWLVLPDGTGDFPDIQSAVSASADGDEILLGDGTFTGPGNWSVNFLGKAITIRSAGGDPAACVVDPGRSASAFRFDHFEGPSSVIADIGIRTNADWGWAVRVWDASPTVRNVVFRFHDAVRSTGGSVRLEDSVLEDGSNLYFDNGAWPVVTGCVWEPGVLVESRGQVRAYDSHVEFDGCTGEGGVFVLFNSSGILRGCALGTSVQASGDGVDLTLQDCDMRGGVRWKGGRVQLVGDGSTLALRDCTIRDGDAGIQLAGDSQATIEGCDIRANLGRGITCTAGSQVSVRRSLVAGNDGTGAAAFGSATSLTIEDCTIAANGGPSILGGGLLVRLGASASLLRTILWGNCAASGPAAWVENATLALDCVNVDPSLVQGGGTVQIGGELLDADPRFCDPVECALNPSTDGDYALHRNSAALVQPCGPMGGLGAGCGFTSVEAASWGAIKSLYR
jgi:hypothetical protein